MSFDVGDKVVYPHHGAAVIERREKREAFGETHAVDLVQPDFLALSAACGVPARLTTEDRIGADLAWAFEQDGPAVVLFKGLLTAAKPTS